MKIHVVNAPGQKSKKGKKKVADKKKPAKKKKRRKSNPSPKKKKGRRRKSNPSAGGVINMMFSAGRGLGGWFAGELFAGFISQRVGGAGPIAFPGTAPQTLPASPYGGRTWSLGTYFWVGLAGAIVSKGVAKFAGAESAANFRKGVMSAMARKLIWTEGFARSPWLHQTFGANPYGQMVARTGDGNTWYQPQQGANWQSMQGQPMGATIFEARPMDNTIVQARPQDTGVGQGSRRHVPLGHSYVSDDADARRHALYHGSGSADLYHAAYAA